MVRERRWNCGIKRLRALTGVTQRDLARATGITHGSIAGIELGYNLNLDHAVKIARYFGMRVEDVWAPLPDQRVGGDGSGE